MTASQRPDSREDTGAGRHYREVLDQSIVDTLSQAVRIIRADPALLLTGTNLLRYQKGAAALRRRNEEAGLLVPPVLILSVTSRCNLTCAGCYMAQRQKHGVAEMTPEVLRSVVAEGAALGVSVFVLAGGEPLLRREEILDLARSFPRVLFPLFTNGLLIDGETAASLAGRQNIVPVISIEGFRQETDRRRGDGVYDRLLATCRRLKGRGSFTGCSMTVTGDTLDAVLDERFITSMLDAGVRVFIYVEYVPIEPGTEHLVLTSNQRQRLHAALIACTERFPALFIGFPGDDGVYGGCLAAGRGFLHVGPSGDLEPCPAAPFSDMNLGRVPLKEALRSDLLQEVRAHQAWLTETEGGCALWTNREWVKGLVERKE